ncbi:MAG TPA: FAD-binding oxidoreductase [Candidatus Aminicenantes bacterium]|nr:FAD-binding oxidoreductase [Candidatus Aminicenantes bacterium]
MAPKSDAIIIGGGIVGLATAAHLVRRGWKVAVLERHHPGAGSTGRCLGGVRSQFSTVGVIRLMERSVAQFRRMEGEFGRPVGYVEGGYLFLAHSAERLAERERLLRRQREHGLPVRTLTAAECRQLVPGLDGEGLLGGVYSPADGQADPFAVVGGYVESIRRGGGTVEFPVEVTGLESAGHRITGVVTGRGERRPAGHVVIAAGPWCADVGRLAGLELPVRAETREALVTDRLPPLLKPMLVDGRPDGCTFCQRPNGQVIGCFTSPSPRTGLETTVTRQFLVQMAKRMVRLLPALATAQVIRQWSGWYEMTSDGLPVIGETSLRGLYVAGGMSGHGFMMGPGTGEYLAELMDGGQTTLDGSEFKPDRSFAGAETLI